jgi:hypothetical protein
MKKNIALVLCSLIYIATKSQTLNDYIKEENVAHIEKKLSSDKMKGREVFTKGIEKAAKFIGKEMRHTGLKKMEGITKKYLQPFNMIVASNATVTGTINNAPINKADVVVLTSNATLTINNTSDFKVVKIAAGDDFRAKVGPLTRAKQNIIVLIDTSYSKLFGGLKRLGGGAKFESAYTQIFALSTADTNCTFNLDIKQDIKIQKLANLVGMLPGKSKKDEFVIFSGHYDHLGYGKPNEQKDSLYNGANDDASGITAVLELAKYYHELDNNERTLLFVAFTAEESGGFGATYFSKQLNADKVVAMFNIEMIGTESKWGTNSAYITGFEKTDFGAILSKNLAATNFKFYPDPYPTQNLFYRSDNATLARLGVPAHTISTSKMDSEKYYHTADDEIETLDMKNMTEIIKAIALSAQTIVNGTDTPSRVKAGDLR